MKKFLIPIIFIIVIIIALLLAVLAYHDVFSVVQLEEKEAGPYTVATKRFIGSYYKVSPTMTEVDNALREKGINASKGVGLFYDDPSETPQDQLRSDVGNLLEDLSEEELAKVREIEGIEIIEIPGQKAVVAQMAIKSPLSYMIAPLKVYPAIASYLAERDETIHAAEGGYAIEIYDIPDKVTTYVMPLPVEN